MADAEQEPVVHILWMNGGLGCDGDSVALTAATQPSIEEIVLGALPGLPKVAVHWPLIDFECGPEQGADTFIEWWHKADRGELEPFVLVVEGSIPNEAIKSEGYWCGFGNNPATRTNGSSSPRSALCHHSMKVSAPCSGPHSKSISGQCTATLGSPGRAPSTISSMLGWVAAVSATESPSQPRPPFIQRMCTTGSSVAWLIRVCGAGTLGPQAGETPLHLP